MEYRINQRTGDRISMLGFGTSYISSVPEEDAVRTIRRAYEGGVNYFDLATADGKTFPYFGKALADVREHVFYQVHFGADYSKGAYGWSTDKNVVKASIARQLEELKTDYIDYGFIHCLDELSDWEAYKKNGILDYLLELKEQGVVRHLGLSSHTPKLILKVLEEVDLDMVMFSVNPAYDYHKGSYGKGTTEERDLVYRTCQSKGIGISVMKPFCGGQLLDENLSPFKKALTHYQCLQYALDRPGVLTVLPGASTVAQVEHLLGFFEADEKAKDYSAIAEYQPSDASGKCVYCNHCSPCPIGLNVALINKYYDLAMHGDTMAVSHYAGLEHHASECVSCGHCNSRCPFHVDQMARMKKIAEYFEI